MNYRCNATHLRKLAKSVHFKISAKKLFDYNQSLEMHTGSHVNDGVSDILYHANKEMLLLPYCFKQQFSTVLQSYGTNIPTTFR